MPKPNPYAQGLLQNPVMRHLLSGATTIMGQTPKQNAMQLGMGAVDMTPVGDFKAMAQGLLERDPVGFGLGAASLLIPGTVKPGMLGNIKGFHGTADRINKFRKRLCHN